MNDTKTTNILLVVMIVLLALFIFKPSLDGASDVQAATTLSEGDAAQAKATESVASANREIASALKGLGKSIETSCDKIAVSISSLKASGN